MSIINCDYCNKEFNIYPARLKNSKIHCCSISCLKKYKEEHKNLNTVCDYCGKHYHLKPSQFKKNNNHFCSIVCYSKYQSENFKGENNHQYGLKGRLNDSWISDEKISTYGYKEIRSLEHPFANKSGFVFEHRLVAEKYLLNDENSIVINGNKYLSKNFQVHHINFNKLDNDVNNLFVITKKLHMKFHDLLYETERDDLGRFASRKFKYDITDTKLLRDLFFKFIELENKNKPL